MSRGIARSRAAPRLASAHDLALAHARAPARDLPGHSRDRYDAVVVGAGPNGLSAAIVLAQEGLQVLLIEATDAVGGACRSLPLTRSGYVHDVGASILPLGIASPFFRTLPLARHGLEWVHPDVPLAHPLDPAPRPNATGGRDAPAAVMHRSIEETAAGLGDDGPAYRKLFEPLVDGWSAVLEEVLQPLVHLPRHPLRLSRFGMRALLPASWLAQRTFGGEKAKALFAGIAAHATVPLSSPGSSALGLMLGMAGHACGWPFPRGGTSRLTGALAAHFRELGGEIVTGWPVESLEELPPARAVILGVTARQLLHLTGPHLPTRYRRRLESFRSGGAAFKLDYALSEPIPWASEACRRAGTVHLGGTLEEIADAERAVEGGRVPERPFILLAQHSLFDDSRAPAGGHTAWMYCHVPHGSPFDMTDRMERQIERFAPGFREIVLDRHVLPPAGLEALNANLVGGDINGGANTLPQLLARPVLSHAPYRLPVEGLYHCSSSTPPGGGVHGMCGYHAARTVLRDLA